MTVIGDVLTRTCRMDAALKKLSAKIMEIRLGDPGLRDSGVVRDLSEKLGRIEDAYNFADQIRETGIEFSEFTKQPTQPLNVVRESVDSHFPLRAGRILCSVFDRGLLEVPGFSRGRNYSDLRGLSPVYCAMRLSTARRLGLATPEPPDPNLLQALRDVVEIYASWTDDKRRDLDDFIGRLCWWSFIRTELIKQEVYRARLGTRIELHWPFVEQYEKQAIGESYELIYSVKQFSGDNKEERVGLRLHTAARIQAEACSILAERLETTAAIESDELLRQVSDMTDSFAATKAEGEQLKASSGPPDPPKGDIELLFQPNGDGYSICAFRESGHQSALKGFNDLHRLIQTPEFPVAMSLLAGEAKPESRSFDEAVDPKGLVAARNKVSELNLEIAATQSAMEKEELQDELDKTMDFIEQSTGLGGRARNLSDGNVTKLRSKIHDRIETATKKLRTATPPMLETASHFEKTVTAEGNSFVYRPGPEFPEWQTDPKQPA